MIRLKINVLNPARGPLNCYLEVPKDSFEAVGMAAIRSTVESTYESLGAEVLSVCRVEEVVHEL